MINEENYIIENEINDSVKKQEYWNKIFLADELEQRILDKCSKRKRM